MLNPRLDGLAEALFREAGDALFLFEPETGQILEVNPTAQRLSGFSRAELLQMQTTSLLQAEGVEAQRQMRSAEQHTTFFHARDGFVLRTSQDNVWIPVNLTITRLHLGSQTLGLITARDVRDFREAYGKLRKFESEMRRVLTSVTDYLWSAKIDVHGRWAYRYCSPVVEGITGRSPRYFIDFVGAPAQIRWGTIVDPRDRPRWDQMIQKIVGGQSVLEEYRVLKADGQVCWVRESVRVSRSEDRAALLLDGVVTDVTAWRNHEAELRAAKDTAEAANRAKSEFLANMSHEIRTPLNGILGMADLAMRTGNWSEQRCYLESLQSSAQSLLTVIHDILDFSKIEAGRLDLEETPFSLRETISEALTMLAVRAHQKGLELSCHVRPQVPDALIGDAARLRQVVVNLVANAVKFTKAGDVVVEVRADEPGRETDDVVLTVQVTDTGIGIPAEKCAAIFDAFVQADVSSTREFGGTGLGLSIASALVHRMGGTISVESESGKGSTFRFTVRVKRDPQAAVAPEVEAERAVLGGRRVLVVDGSAHSRRILSDVLTSWEIEPTVVPDAKAAAAAFARAYRAGRPFDLFLIDARREPGTPLRPFWREFALGPSGPPHPSCAVVPVVLMLSTANLGEDAEECRRVGADAYVTKPIRESALRSILAAVLQPADPVSAAEPAAAEPPRPLRVLLAEDNAVNQLYAATLLQQAGHCVCVARSGREALAAFEREPFDLALMDIEMPEMDGFAATAAIRQREQATGRHLPILALTAHAVKGFREQCLAAGMDGYLSKPVGAQELLDMVARTVDLGAGSGEWKRLGADAPKHAARLSPSRSDILRTSAPRPPFDRAAALARVEGNAEMFHTLIDSYLREAPAIQANLRRAVEQRHSTAVNRAAHALTGMLGVFSAAPAQAVAARLKDAPADWPLAAALVTELDRELVTLNAALRRETGDGAA